MPSRTSDLQPLRPLSPAAVILARKWELEDVVFHEGTRAAEIYFAKRNGMDVVLKIPNPDVIVTSDPSSEPNSSSEQRALLHYTGFGAVRLWADHETGFLLERIIPGKSLSAMALDGRDDEAMEIICDVAGELHNMGPDEKLPPLPDWHDRYDAYGKEDGSHLLPAATYKRAKGLYLEMVLSQGHKVALHGDLHHDNILFDHNRGWVAIDPHGYLGEPAYEFSCALRNPGDDPRVFAKPAILARRLEIIVERTGLDRTRLLLWSYTTAVLSALWSLEDGEDPARGISTAIALETLL